MTMINHTDDFSTSKVDLENNSLKKLRMISTPEIYKFEGKTRFHMRKKYEEMKIPKYRMPSLYIYEVQFSVYFLRCYQLKIEWNGDDFLGSWNQRHQMQMWKALLKINGHSRSTANS